MNLPINAAKPGGFSQLPRFVCDLLAAPPQHGEGVHNYLFRLARVLHPYRTEPEIISLLRSVTDQCGRNVPEREILDAIRNSKPAGWRAQLQHWESEYRVRPKVNQEQVEAVLSSGLGAVDLWEVSPVRLGTDECHTEEVIDALFPGESLLCCGWAHDCFDTRLRNEWRGCLSGMQFIVPSPMSKRVGWTQAGHQSTHSLDNTGSRHFLVVEFDQGSTDSHAAILLHLAERAPLALALHSGSKSLHGWFYCARQTDQRLRAFMQSAVNLGADPATWVRSQFVRMPDGRRANGSRQPVLFFNPEVV